MHPITHGLARRKQRHRLFGRWKQMRQRCENPNDPGYKNYGGRGIKVCARWQFFPWFVSDMDSNFIPGMTIERMDNNGPYSPENCIWGTRYQQANNNRRNRRITFNDLTLNVTAWSKKVGISTNTLFHRLKAGWSIRDSLELPARAKRRD